MKGIRSTMLLPVVKRAVDGGHVCAVQIDRREREVQWNALCETLPSKFIPLISTPTDNDLISNASPLASCSHCSTDSNQARTPRHLNSRRRLRTYDCGFTSSLRQRQLAWSLSLRLDTIGRLQRAWDLHRLPGAEGAVAVGVQHKGRQSIRFVYEVVQREIVTAAVLVVARKSNAFIWSNFVSRSVTVFLKGL